LSFSRANDNLSIVKKRENLAKAIYDLAKLVFAALVLGPIVTPEAFSVPSLIAGATATLLLG
jgi:hypothetical protein